MIVDIINKLMPVRLADMLLYNGYEQLVPYNLWFKDPNYRVLNASTRIRLWKNISLTPLSGNLDVINQKIIDNMTVYQPFYPEQFFQTSWMIKHYDLKTSSVLAICLERNLGCMEAAFYHQDYFGNGTFDILNTPKHHYLSVYGVNIGMTRDQYDLIWIDLMDLQESVTSFNIDYEKTLEYYEKFKSMGKVVVRVNINKPFKAGHYTRVPMTHIWNGECYWQEGEDNYADVYTEWISMAKEPKKQDVKTTDFLHIKQLKLSNYKPLCKHTIKYSEGDDDIDFSKLITAKNELNRTKRVMDTMPTDKSKYDTWETISKKLSVSQSIKIRMSYEKHKTNAWLKCMEIISQFPIFGTNCFHICEAPGAFILACRDYATSHHREYNWKAQTLSPDVDGALDDHFGIIANNPDKWMFGDLTDPSVIKSYSDKYDLITADGGITCPQNMLNEYETLMNPLFLGQTICILNCLKQDGCALLKAFLPLANHQTISIVSTLARVFKTVRIIKPVTSHSCNSEVYLVLQKYRGVEPDVLDNMYSCLESNTPYTCPISNAFYQQYESAVLECIRNQIEALHTHYLIYYDPSKIDKMNMRKEEAVDNWFMNN